MPEVVSIVACGPTALECGAARAPGYVIAVNDAYRHVRHDAVLSMDGRWMLHRLPDFGGRYGPPLHVRRRALSKLGGFNPQLWPRVQVFDCDHHCDDFSESLSAFNGPNSGYCALNLAYVLRPKKVWLFGFDHRGGHFHPKSEWRERGEGCGNSPRKFADWSTSCYIAQQHFEAVGIKVVNTNPHSLVRAFEFGALP